MGSYQSGGTAEKTDNIHLRDEIKEALYESAFKLLEDFDFVTVKTLTHKADKRQSHCD